MKSNSQQLRSRGFISDNELKPFIKLSRTILISLLKSKLSYERTASVRLLSSSLNVEHIPVFCKMLETEKSLYTKIEICNAIANYGESAIPYLLPLLGKIGKNQHKEIKLVDINKKSFPLPRDIVARILIRIGPVVLPHMESLLAEGNYYQKLEAVDVIGHVCWNYRDFRSENVCLQLFYSALNDPLLKWKLIRAFQPYESKQIVDVLEKIIGGEDNEIIKTEARRSLNRIMSRRGGR